MRLSSAKRARRLDDILAGERMAHRNEKSICFPRVGERAEYPMSKLSRLDRIAVHCDGIIDIVSAMFNVSGREMREPGRKSLGVCRVRQIAMYVAHVTFGLSMRDVGIGFARDRTTVLHACHLVEDMRDDIEFDRIVSMVERVVSVAFRQVEQE